ncbi:hypothetical protein AQUCO_09300012v1 [Aquilegia coerulea]|nr:hypothetical protein AQUCO_09300012v1 [Aquilegia coerulea]
MDLNSASASPASTPSSQMDSIFDPMFTTSFEEELKPLEISMPSSFDMNIQYQEEFVDSSFDPIQVKTEILPIGDNWEVSDGLTETGSIFDTLSGINETHYFNTSEEGFGLDQSQLNGVESNVNVVDAGGIVNVVDAVEFANVVNAAAGGIANVVDAGGFANVVGVENIGQGLYPYYPHHQQGFGDFHVGTWNRRTHPMPPNMIERRRRRMIKNRESAARSRARRLAHNAQQQLEIEKLKEENQFLKRVLRTLVDIVNMHNENDFPMTGISRTFSGPLPPQSRL